MFHSPNTLNKMPPQTRLGLVDQATLPPPEQKAPAADEAERQKAREEMPPAHGMTLLPDFEVWAQKVLSTVAWAYYRSAADQERSENPRSGHQRRVVINAIRQSMTAANKRQLTMKAWMHCAATFSGHVCFVTCRTAQQGHHSSESLANYLST